VLGITDNRLEVREEAQLVTPAQPPATAQPAAPVQVPLPPMQVLSGAGKDNLWEMIVSLFATQPQPLVVDQAAPCALGMSVASSASATEAQVGDTDTFSYAVTNDGTVPMTDAQIDTSLPDGLSLVKRRASIRIRASSAGN
jgi:uncharacterized repeat protein (TIGR01451 family)